MAVLGGIGFEASFSLDRPVDLLGGDRAFLYDSMRNNCGDCPVKEIQNPVLKVMEGYAQLIDPVAEEVRFRTSQLMSHLS